MIQDDLRTALHQALVTCGLPEPSGGITLEPARSREHGDWATNVAMKLAKPARQQPDGARAADQGCARRRASSPCGQRRSRAARLRQSLPGALMARRRAARSSVKEGELVRAVRGPRGPGDQPRVRLGEPDRSAPRGRRALGRGRRRDRQPPRRAGRGRPPRVLPERRGQPAPDRSATRCTPATAARRRPRTGTRASTSSRWRRSCAPSSATT